MSENKNVFQKINDWIRNVESSIVNLLSSIAPWGAPLPAAYMSYNHMIGALKFDSWVAVPVAFVIEILGFSTVSTILSFWMHNRKYQDETKKSPVMLVIGAFAFYLFLVVTMNVLIDASTDQWWSGGAIIAVRALLTLMSIPAALVLAVRTQHQEMLNDFAEKSRERAFKKHYGDEWFEKMYGSPSSQGSENHREPKEHSPKYREVYEYISQVFSETGQVPTLESIVEKCSVVKSYASTIRKEWSKENQ